MLAIDGLRPLHQSMRGQGIDRYRFRYRHGRAEFDVFFFADGSPYRLLFGARGHAFSFEFEVLRGYQVNPRLEKPDYRELCRILGIQYDPSNPFSVRAFLTDFSGRIPDHATEEGRVRYADLIVYRPQVDEAEKRYFVGWRNHKGKDTDVTEKNLTKTRELLGQRAFETCNSKRISSVWTTDATRALDFYPPE